MYSVTNRIPISKGSEAEFEDRFEHRVTLIEKVKGFRGLAVWRVRERGGEKPQSETLSIYLVQTFWEDVTSFLSWTKSDAFRKAHQEPLPQSVLAGETKIEMLEPVIKSGIMD